MSVATKRMNEQLLRVSLTIFENNLNLFIPILGHNNPKRRRVLHAYSSRHLLSIVRECIPHRAVH